MLVTWQVWESCDGSGRGFCWERSSPATTSSATASSGRRKTAFDGSGVSLPGVIMVGSNSEDDYDDDDDDDGDGDDDDDDDDFVVGCGCGDGGGRINWLETSERFGNYGTWKHGIFWKMIEKYEFMMKLEPLSKTKTGRQTRVYWTEWPMFSLSLWFVFCAGNYGESPKWYLLMHDIDQWMGKVGKDSPSLGSI